MKKRGIGFLSAVLTLFGSANSSFAGWLDWYSSTGGTTSISINANGYSFEPVCVGSWASAGTATDHPCFEWPSIEDHAEYDCCWQAWGTSASAYVPYDKFFVLNVESEAHTGYLQYEVTGEIRAYHKCCGHWYMDGDGNPACSDFVRMSSGSATGQSGVAYRIRAANPDGLRSAPWTATIDVSFRDNDARFEKMVRSVSIVGDPASTTTVVYQIQAQEYDLRSPGLQYDSADDAWIEQLTIEGTVGEYDLGSRRIEYMDGQMDLDGDGRFNQLDVDVLSAAVGEECRFIGLCGFDYNDTGDIDTADVDILQLLIDQGLGSGVFGDLSGDDVMDCDILNTFDAFLDRDLEDPGYRIVLDYDLDGVVDAEDKAAIVDCNSNGIPDHCDLADGTSQDLNGNAVPDECEDCNNNGVIDQIDIAGGTSEDCSGNYIPDECENDCNQNGTADSCDIWLATSEDCDSNGIPDECEIADLDGDGIQDVCETDCNGNRVPDEWELDRCDVAQSTPGCSNYCIQECVCDIDDYCCTTEWDSICIMNLDYCDLCPVSTDLNENGVPDNCEPDCDYDGIVDEVELTLMEALSEDYTDLTMWEAYDADFVTVDAGPFDGSGLRVKTSKQVVRGASLRADYGVDLSDVDRAVLAFDWMHVANGAGWGQTYCPAEVLVSYFDGSSWVEFAKTDPGLGAAFEVEIPSSARDSEFRVRLDAIVEWTPACFPGDEDTSMWIDNLEILKATHSDCDDNGIPDLCDLYHERDADCNSNGVMDGCDIDQLVSHDGDQNGIPDECEHIIFVKQDATGANDGTSWDDAFNDLQDALAAARADAAGPENVWAIWVAQGTYKPTDTTDRTKSFVIDFSFIPIYGGFAGNETQERQRNWMDNPTVLNGKILDGLGDHTHSYHVVQVDGHAFIDGFVIEYGVARSGTEDSQDLGGGVYCRPHSILDIRHSVIRNNAAIHGGAIYAGDAFVLMNTCLVYYNYATLYGGAIYSAGPFMLPFPSSINETRVINSTIARNRAIGGGGGIYHTDGDANVLASIIVENTRGPLEAPQHDEITLGECTRASLIWVDPEHVQIATPMPCTMAIEYSDLGYAYEGPPAIVDEDPSDPLVVDIRNGVISENPRFINAGIEEFQLRQDSPCVDSGVTAMGNLLDRDLDGNPRLMFGRDSGHLDMGAYEYNPNVLWTRDCNLNTVADNDDIADGTSLDCDINGLPDECECDCNSNGQPDLCDIAQGTSQDCNGNSIPDECEPDCNNNGTADSCDIDNEASSDVNWNGIPDECDPDCNTNSIPDDRDFAMGVSQDCNESNIPDECEIAASTSGDCNLNGIPDECDVADGTSADTNNNGTPDECEDAPPALTDAVSQKIHGTGLTAVTRGIAEGGVECRRDGITTVKLSFDKRAKASDGTNFSVSDFELSRGTVTNVTGMWLLQPPYSGSVTLTILGVDTPGPFSIAFTAENTVGVEDSYDVCWTYVPGDVDADGDVDDDDLKAMEDVYKLPRGSSTFRYDLDLDNVIEANPGEDDYLTLSSSNPTAQQTMCNN